MSEVQENNLDPKIKTVWRIDTAIWLLLIFACLVIPLYIGNSIAPIEVVSHIIFGLWIAFAISIIVGVFILPPIRYIRWKYIITQDFLEIKRGIFWRKHFVIPFIRVQNTDTKQGPVMRACGLASVTVATAAGNHEIPGLRLDVADKFRDRAAELARIAREDV